MVRFPLHLIRRGIPYRWLPLGLALASCCLSGQLKAQSCTLICNPDLQVALDGNGQAQITSQLIAPNAGVTCPGPLQLSLFNAQGQQLGNPLTCNQIGQSVTAQLRHLATNNSCTSTLTVTDQFPPVLSCPEKWIFCSQEPDPAVIGTPVVSDNCTPAGSLALTYFDQYADLPCGSFQAGQPVTAHIERNWTVQDASGNASECIQHIWVRQATLADIDFPANRDNISAPSLQCGQDPEDLELTGSPTIGGKPVDPVTCDVAVTYTDQVIPVCPPAGYAVLRTWVAADFCAGGILQRIQIIRVEDKTPPVLVAPPVFTAGTDPYGCTATLTLPAATATDQCSAVTVTPSWSYGSGYGPFSGVAKGMHTVVYTATDACGNTATASAQVQVIDNVAPQVICSASLQVGLSAGGSAQVTAAMVDAGSTDNCGAVTLALSRDDITFGPTVIVTCADLGPPVPLTLRATDAAGQENFCQVQVNVRDFLKPTLACPPDITLSCLDDVTDLQLAGSAQAADNCALGSLTFFDQLNLDACHAGTVTRHWVATDSSGNERSCAQAISMQVVNTLSVQFPADVTLTACAGPDALAPPATGQPALGGQACTTPSVTYTDELLTAPPGVPVCFRLLRQWKVIEWCTYDLNGGGAGLWEHTQVIDVADQQGPALQGPPDLTINADLPGCQAQVGLPAVTAADCSLPVVYTHDSPYAFAPGADASGIYPAGIHAIRFTATDGCGNQSLYSFQLTVRDQSTPVPLCQAAVALALGSGGTAAVDPMVLDAGSSDLCAPAGQLQFGAQPANFGCSDLGPRAVTLTVTDPAGNTATCLSTVVVEDPAGACGGPPVVVEGFVRTESGAAAATLPVMLTSAAFGEVTATDSAGLFRFEDVPAGGPYVLQPACDSNWLNGVTTYDLVLISRHILGLQPLPGPHRMIAADANRSGAITTFDIVQLRKLILGINAAVAGNTSWRFVPAAFNFPDTLNPWAAPFPETLTWNDLTAGQSGQNFIAIKTGDLNGSADAADPRSAADTLFLRLPDRHLSRGNSVVVPLELNAWQDLEGLQFELGWDTTRLVCRGLEFVHAGGPDAEHVFARDGLLALSWQPQRQGSSGEETVLLGLRLEAREDVRLSDAVFMANNRLSPEAYRRGAARPSALALDFWDDPRQWPGRERTVVLQPNPFGEKASLSWYAEQAGETRLEVMDATTGRLVLERRGLAVTGWNEWMLDTAPLPGPGVYVLRISGGGRPAKALRAVYLGD